MSYKNTLPKIVLLSALMVTPSLQSFADERFYDWENTGLPKLEVDLSAIDNIDSTNQVFSHSDNYGHKAVSQQPLAQGEHTYGDKPTMSEVNSQDLPSPMVVLDNSGLYESPTYPYPQHGKDMPVDLSPNLTPITQKPREIRNTSSTALRSRVFTSSKVEPKRHIPVTQQAPAIRSSGPVVKPPSRSVETPKASTPPAGSLLNRMAIQQPKEKPRSPFIQRPSKETPKAEASIETVAEIKKPIVQQVGTVKTVLPVEPVDFPEFAEAKASTEISKSVPNIKHNIDAAPRFVASEDMSLSFTSAETDLSIELKKQLNEIARVLEGQEDKRLELRAYAAAVGNSNSSARRLSLARALSVRSYLMEQGIRPTRVDVRALGDETDQMPLDRVDMVFVK